MGKRDEVERAARALLDSVLGLAGRATSAASDENGIDRFFVRAGDLGLVDADVVTLRAALALPDEAGGAEAVAWGVFIGESFKCALDSETEAREAFGRYGYAIVPLYAAPLPAAPSGEVERARVVLRLKMAECGVDGSIFDTLWSCDVAPIFAAERAERGGKGGDRG